MRKNSPPIRTGSLRLGCMFSEAQHSIGSPRMKVDLLRRLGSHLLIQLLLHRFEIEARALLHGREFEEGLRLLAHLLLKEDEAPELVAPPVHRHEGLVQARAFEGIKA